MELGCIDADRMSVLKLDPEFPFIKRIVLQHTIWEVRRPSSLAPIVLLRE